MNSMESQRYQPTFCSMYGVGLWLGNGSLHVPVSPRLRSGRRPAWLLGTEVRCLPQRCQTSRVGTQSGHVATGPEQVLQGGFFSTCFSLLFTLNAGKAMGRHRVGNWGFLGDSVGKESACNAGDLCLIPGLGRSPGAGNGNPFWYSCLENFVDRRTSAGGLEEGRGVALQSMGLQKGRHD